MILSHRDAGQGSPVVLLHGLFGSARNLGGVARALAAQHRVVSIDARNHGESPHDPVMDYDEMAGDVADTMDALGLPQAAVLGHSMGGKIGMRLALTQPARVTRLVVADIAPVPNPPNFSAYANALLALPADLSRTEADARLAPDIPDPAVRSFLLHNYRPREGWRIGLPQIASGIPAMEDWPPLNARYDGPALFVTGALSPYVQPAHRPVILRLFPAARFVAIKGAGHWLHAEQPDAFNATVAAFLAAAGG